MPRQFPEPLLRIELKASLWDDERPLMYEHSPLARRYRRSATSVRRTALDHDR